MDTDTRDAIKALGNSIQELIMALENIDSVQRPSLRLYIHQARQGMAQAMKAVSS